MIQMTPEQHMIAAHFWPKPQCCTSAQRYPFVIVDVSRVDDKGDTPTASWVWGVIGSEDRTAGYSGTLPPGPTICPFCGAGLPRLRLRKNPPAPLCIPSDHYCLTCNERLMSCECYPPQCGWEVVP